MRLQAPPATEGRDFVSVTASAVEDLDLDKLAADCNFNAKTADPPPCDEAIASQRRAPTAELAVSNRGVAVPRISIASA